MADFRFHFFRLKPQSGSNPCICLTQGAKNRLKEQATWVYFVEMTIDNQALCCNLPYRKEDYLPKNV